MPQVSVITINLNNASGLEATINSVAAQKYDDFEFIIIDGASTDGSEGIIEAFGDKVDYWVSEKDSGIFHAMNKGIAVAKGEYLLFLNSGDTLYSDDTLSEFFSLNGSDLPEILYGDTLFIFPDGKTMRKNAVDKLTLDYLIKDDINHQSCFIKASLFKKLGFYDESLKIAGDHKFFLNAFALNNTSYRHYNVIVSRYNLQGLSFTNRELQDQERSRIQKEILPELIYDMYFEHDKEMRRRDNRIWKRIENKFKSHLRKQ